MILKLIWILDDIAPVGVGVGTGTGHRTEANAASAAAAVPAGLADAAAPASPTTPAPAPAAGVDAAVGAGAGFGAGFGATRGMPDDETLLRMFDERALALAEQVLCVSARPPARSLACLHSRNLSWSRTLHEQRTKSTECFDTRFLCCGSVPSPSLPRASPAAAGA